jgi:ABC-type spermidine/putrescine transport system permease subunit II
MRRTDSDNPAAASDRFQFGRSAAAWIVALIALTLVILPLAWFAVSVLQSPAPARTSGAVPDQVLAQTPWSLFVSSVGWAGAVGLLATAAAWPVAWAARRRPWLVIACMIPLALPNYLCYAALNLARSPSTPLGDWIQRLAAGDEGWTQAPIIAGRVIAGLGLVLWIWPLSLLALLPTVRAISDETLDQLDLESRGFWTHFRMRIALCRGGLLAAVVAAMVVILGSPVPLHVAQVPTASMAVWVGLVQDPGNPRHWLTGWPLLVVAAATAAWLARWLVLAPASPETASETARFREQRIWRLWPLAASTLIPLVLLTRSLHEWVSIPRFIHLGIESMGASLMVGGVVASLALVLGCRVWFVAGTPGRLSGPLRWVAIAVLSIFAAATLSPGVMIGAAVARAFSRISLAGMDDSLLPLIAAHLVRYAAIMMIACALLRRAEPADLGDAIRLDGAEGVWGFLSMRVWPNRLPLAAAWLLTLSLSVHDIDTSIMVQPPGSQSLAERMLGFLHFAKTEELCAGSIIFEAVGIAFGAVIYLLARLQERGSHGTGVR